MRSARPITVGFLLFPGFPMSCLTSAIEPLRVANEISGTQVFDWLLISEDSEKVASSARVAFDIDRSVDQVDGLDYLFLLSDPASRYRNSATSMGRLRHLSRHGVAVGAISGGVFPLARAGLLSGFTASVHWCYRTVFESEFPEVELSDEVLVIDRSCQTASGAAAAFDLMLHLIGDRISPEVATEVACWFQHPMIRGTGVRQKVPTVSSDSTTDTIPAPVRKAIDILTDHIADTISISDVSRKVHVSQRQLERIFKATTGQSPSIYYRTLRMNAARQLVRYSGQPMLDVANQVGCSTVTQLSRHYRSVHGVTPFEDRRAVRGIRVEASD